MKATSLRLLTLGCFILAMWAVQSLAAEKDTVELSGTWSGSWVTQGGVRDAVTVQLRQESSGNVNGKFLTPVPMDLTKAIFSPKTHSVVLEAIDEKSGKHYKIDGKVLGAELKGSLVAGNVAGELDLIKWTFNPRPY